MKQYQILMEVPDDFVPEEMELTANYKDEISIVGEGFSSEEVGAQIVEAIEKASKDVANKLDIDKLKLDSQNDVVIVKYPKEMTNEIATVQLAKASLSAALGQDRAVIMLCDDMDLLVKNNAEAIEMLKKMIDTINLKSSIVIES